MTSLRHRVIQRIGVLCTAALLLLPLALSGHRHQTAQASASDTCALCVATHFSPATTAPPLPQLAAAVVTVTTAALTAAPPARRCHSRPSGRAPPQSLFLFAV